MLILDTLPEYSVRRLAKVFVRTVHLVGIAGVFGNAMVDTSESVYFTLAIISGFVLVIMDVWGGQVWFFQLKGIAVYVKLLLLIFMHLFPEGSVSCLITIIVISGFMSHAPNWIRSYSLKHRKVVHANHEMLG